MKLAFVGKGGVGKSTIAGTFARLLAQAGEPVLALDSDPMPGMSFSIGVSNLDAGIPDELIETYRDDTGRQRYRLRPEITTSALIEGYAVRGPDGIRFLQLGKARGPQWNNGPQHAAFQQVVDALPADNWHVVGDLPAGTRQPFQGWARFAQQIMVVVEPSPASILTGRRLARLGQMSSAPQVGLVVSKARLPGDAEDVASRTGLPLFAVVPLDDSLIAAARLGLPLVDHAPSAPAVQAVASLATRLLTGKGSI